MTAWVVILVAGVGCYLLRIAMVMLLGDRQTPPWLERTATFVMPAAFAALAAYAIAGPTGLHVGDALPKVIAIAVAIAVAHRTRSTGITLATGLPALWLATAAVSV